MFRSNRSLSTKIPADFDCAKGFRHSDLRSNPSCNYPRHLNRSSTTKDGHIELWVGEEGKIY